MDLNVKKVYHWASKNVKQSGYDDMVLLPKINEQAILDNLKKRFMDNYIYTYIGPVLISINPYKELPYFSDHEVEQYKGATQIENPPHIYAVADFMYRNMLIDSENQCVIISGESGAGKTVCAKYIMSYVSKVSGGNQNTKVQHIKEIVLQSNPLLEAFGNAKTLRNNNSSRFGKYVEIQFNRSGEPKCGKITNFLLEKSRVVGQMKNERSFHIFYQLCSYVNDPHINKNLELQEASRFLYLNRSGCYKVDGINDSNEFKDTLKAMNVISISKPDQESIFGIISGILHLGNVTFVTDGNYAQPENMKSLEYPSKLLGIDLESLKKKLTSRTIETKASSQQERIDVTLNVQQAEYTRDALAKGIYSRLFDYLVLTINNAMQVTNENLLNIGILDIYGFEIFEENGFEQFCINYVNEKLQQIFIELTLKAEQEEYKKEGIKWTDIDYFNNKIVLDLIESKNSPPGLFSICDDVVITMHATGDGADTQLLQKLQKSYGGHQHFVSNSVGFQIKHYAGNVDYKINGFCEKNRDILFQDLIDLMNSSSIKFISNLFPDLQSGMTKKKPTTAGNKIKTDANQLVEKLMKCYPSYIRCIKPNETKQAREIDESRVNHQIKYLGLVENVRVRRAGFAYRREFVKFIQRYSIVCKETKFWTGPVDKGIKLIMDSVNMDADQWQMGKTKVFIKAPESLFLLEEIRDRRYNEYALILQKAFRKFNAIQYYLKLKNEAADLLHGKKQRRHMSLNRKFYGDYIGLANQPGTRALIAKRENVEFAQTVTKYDRLFKKQKRDLILTNKAIYIIGREQLKDKNNKKTIAEVIKRRIEYNQINKLVLSNFKDNFVVMFPNNDYATVLEIEFKTEFLTTFSKRFKETQNGRTLNIEFNNSVEYQIKKDGFLGGGTRTLKFTQDNSLKDVQLKSTGKMCNIKVPAGLPNDSRPKVTYYENYNFSSETWWPKFENMKRKYNINIVKGDKSVQKSKTQSNRQFNINNNNNSSLKSNNHMPVNNNIVENTSNNVVQNTSSNFLNKFNEELASKFNNNKNNNNNNKTDDNNNTIKPLPVKPPIKQRKPQVEPNYPKCKALYSYSATEPDELTFKEGDIIYIVNEDPQGWWKGIHHGKTGLFPSNYITKI